MKLKDKKKDKKRTKENKNRKMRHSDFVTLDKDSSKGVTENEDSITRLKVPV